MIPNTASKKKEEEDLIFCLDTPTPRTFQFKAESKEERDSWIASIASVGAKAEPLATPVQPGKKGSTTTKAGKPKEEKKKKEEKPKDAGGAKKDKGEKEAKGETEEDIAIQKEIKPEEPPKSEENPNEAKNNVVDSQQEAGKNEN